MRRAILTTCMLLLCGLWAVAQESNPQSSQPTTSSQATSTGNATTIQGCLSGSSGNYTLTDKSGTAYQLTGKTEKLSSHVGHEISVTGTPSQSSTASASGGAANPSSAASPSAASPSAASPSASASTGQTFEVKSFKHVATTCSSSSGSSAQPTPPSHH